MPDLSPEEKEARLAALRRFRRDYKTRFVLCAKGGKQLAEVDPERLETVVHQCQLIGGDQYYVKRIDFPRRFHE